MFSVFVYGCGSLKSHARHVTPLVFGGCGSCAGRCSVGDPLRALLAWLCCLGGRKAVKGRAGREALLFLFLGQGVSFSCRVFMMCHLSCLVSHRQKRGGGER